MDVCVGDSSCGNVIFVGDDSADELTDGTVERPDSGVETLVDDSVAAAAAAAEINLPVFGSLGSRRLTLGASVSKAS